MAGGEDSYNLYGKQTVKLFTEQCTPDSGFYFHHGEKKNVWRNQCYMQMIVAELFIIMHTEGIFYI